MPDLLQQTLFGDPEPVTSYRARETRDDLPVACERELLWPSRLVSELVADGMSGDEAVGLLERLYGDLPRRTRLRTSEVCRRLRCDRNVVYKHRESGALPAVDVSAGTGVQPDWRFYRAGVVLFLAGREFGGPVPTRTEIPTVDLQRLSRVVVRMRMGH